MIFGIPHCKIPSMASPRACSFGLLGLPASHPPEGLLLLGLPPPLFRFP